jgi:hypothetical protein
MYGAMNEEAGFAVNEEPPNCTWIEEHSPASSVHGVLDVNVSCYMRS